MREAVMAARSQAGLEVINKHKNRQHLLSYGCEAGPAQGALGERSLALRNQLPKHKKPIPKEIRVTCGRNKEICEQDKICQVRYAG
jgi:hypothetical protein